MKVIKRYNQHRRDLTIDTKCEGCGTEKTFKNAYDDTNYWVNVVPSFKCPKCEKSSVDLGINSVNATTRYPAGLVI